MVHSRGVGAKKSQTKQLTLEFRRHQVGDVSVMCISRKAFVRVMGPLKELLSRNMGEHARPSPRAALPCASPRAHPTTGVSVSCAEIGVRGRRYSPCVSLIAHSLPMTRRCSSTRSEPPTQTVFSSNGGTWGRFTVRGGPTARGLSRVWRSHRLQSCTTLSSRCD